LSRLDFDLPPALTPTISYRCSFWRAMAALGKMVLVRKQPQRSCYE
jgi:hypothetical protein